MSLFIWKNYVYIIYKDIIIGETNITYMNCIYIFQNNCLKMSFINIRFIVLMNHYLLIKFKKNFIVFVRSKTVSLI